jgi:PHD/YefM family antitoxin component YafN of YafNO toxin-antitoxin module
MKPGLEQCDVEDFKTHLERYLERVRRSEVPLFVTHPTEGAVVMMSVASFVELQRYAPPRPDLVQRVTVEQLIADEELLKASPKKRSANPSAQKVRSKKSSSNEVYQLKITLKHVRPPIWRRVLVPGSFTLGQLHIVIQVVMDGWCGGHLHEFEIDGVHYSDPPPPREDWGVAIVDEAKVKLEQVLGEKSKFLYSYDFGDDWQHEILVEKVLPIDPQVSYPVCIKAKRACPPEDCGGPWGYAELLEILADPTHPEYEERCEWLIADFDAELFDVKRVNNELEGLGNRWR